jgi:hypothetical protein
MNTPLRGSPIIGGISLFVQRFSNEPHGTAFSVRRCTMPGVKAAHPRVSFADLVPTA